MKKPVYMTPFLVYHSFVSAKRRWEPLKIMKTLTLAFLALAALAAGFEILSLVLPVNTTPVFHGGKWTTGK